jgi:hypothetical protein
MLKQSAGGGLVQVMPWQGLALQAPLVHPNMQVVSVGA